MKTIFTLVALLFSLSAIAQISGKVTDEKHQPLPGAGIQIYTDSSKPVKTLITGTDGRFSANLSANYIIISYTGYLSDTIKIIKQEMIITLMPDLRLLKEVSIKGRQPVISQETDRTVINVNEQVRKLADNALEIINLAPGITVSDNDDAILMSGKSEVQVMLNDKIVKMTPRDLAKFL